MKAVLLRKQKKMQNLTKYVLLKGAVKRSIFCCKTKNDVTVKL